MCWRQVSKIQKTVWTIIAYFIAYLVISFVITPEPPVSFVSKEIRVGDKYGLIYLVQGEGGAAPVFSDAEGADVFTARHCGACFITNNRGFLPMAEYDAILILGERSLLAETAAFMDPGKRYLIEASKKCVASKLRGCMRDPTITSFTTRQSYTLCSLCSELLEAKHKHKT